REVGKSGWIQTTVNPSDITILSGTRSVNNNFGNFKLACITGKKYLDLTGNGITYDDKPLGGVTINLYQGTSTNGPLLSSATTGSDGAYHFNNLAPGTYFVQEVVPNGSVQTTGKAGYVVTVGPGGIGSGGTASGKNFGDYNPLCGQICKMDFWA